MTTQPEALLADADIESILKANMTVMINYVGIKNDIAVHIDDELRRLHEENLILTDSVQAKADRIDRLGEQVVKLHQEVQEQCRLNGMGSEREARLMAINQELLKALKLAIPDLKGYFKDIARAAIAKATGE